MRRSDLRSSRKKKSSRIKKKREREQNKGERKIYKRKIEIKGMSSNWNHFKE